MYLCLRVECSLAAQLRIVRAAQLRVEAAALRMSVRAAHLG